ncbi:MAG: CBS domain-containing protein [Alphaproteobacteria bacterium]|nr:CBS domain-containing protein [Alphaproteobacteria bacterium]
MTAASKVRDYMSSDLVTVSPEMDIHAAIKVLLAHQLSGVPVLDARGALVGILSKKDCLKVAFSASYHQDWAGTVADCMNHPVDTVDEDANIVEVAELFVKKPYHRYPVIRAGRLVGIVSRHDILRAIETLW